MSYTVFIFSAASLFIFYLPFGVDKSLALI